MGSYLIANHVMCKFYIKSLLCVVLYPIKATDQMVERKRGIKSNHGLFLGVKELCELIPCILGTYSFIVCILHSIVYILLTHSFDNTLKCEI